MQFSGKVKFDFQGHTQEFKVSRQYGPKQELSTCVFQIVVSGS